MTVATETDKTGPLPCNGATTVFNYLFRILDEDDLEVILTDSAGAETVLTKTTHYTVTGVGDAAGGSITTVSTYASGNTITLVRNPDLVQEVDLQNQGAFLAESIERALDRATMQVQKAYGAAARGLQVPKSDASASLEIPTAATRAGKALIFDDDGNATAGGVPDVAVSAPMYPVVQAVDLATARTEFGLGDLSTLDAVGTAQITDEAVTLAKMANLAAKKFIARFTNSTGVPEAGDVADEFALDATAKKLYFKGGIQGGHKNLKIVSADAGTSSVVTIDAITVEDTNGYSKRLQTVSETIDLSTSGANGLDTGTVAAAIWYYLWVIAKEDGTVDGLASTSPTAPTMPSGYTFKALIGAVRTKSGSAVLVGTIQYGRSVQYTTPALPSLSSGAVGTYGSAWGAAISVESLVPTAIASRIYVLAWNTAATSRIVVAPNSSYDPAIDSATKAPPVAGGAITGASNTITSSTVGSFLLESTNVYVSSAASTQSVVVGFDLNL